MTKNPFGGSSMDRINEFDELYLPCHEALFRTALYYGSKYKIAEDLLQQTVIEAIQHFPQLKNKAYFKTWITRILINNFKQYYRKFKSLEKVSMEKDVCSGDSCDSVVESLYIQELLEKLDNKYRTVVVLKYMNDMTIDEISQALKIPQSTVKSRLYRALRKLENEISKGDIDVYERA